MASPLTPEEKRVFTDNLSDFEALMGMTKNELKDQSKEVKLKTMRAFVKKCSSKSDD